METHYDTTIDIETKLPLLTVPIFNHEKTLFVIL
jgi:hypothetical protein